MTLLDLFGEQLSVSPSSVAVRDNGTDLTYTELNEKASRLSNSILRQSPSSSIIGISTTRSIEMIIAVLAILKAGKAYLPLDPSYPHDRLQQIVTDSGIDCCLSDKTEISFFQSLGLSVIDSGKDYNEPEAKKDNQSTLAYVLYTSGSTGKPKGVCMGHDPLVNLLQWQRQHSSAGQGTRTLQFAPLSFDVSFQEIFATLTTGGILVLIEDDLRLDPQSLLKFIEKESINRIFVPFVALQYLTEAADANQHFPRCLEEVMTAGEQLKVTPQVVRFFSALPGVVLYNQYGPTECHVVTELKLDGDPAQWPALPSIGKAIDNTEMLILDENFQQLPGGEIGELCITGKCLAEGYLNRPELTKEKFITVSFPGKKDIRVYKTGDLARYLPDGNIEFLGRRDDQVKIRGYRIELGEIEVVLNKLEGIQQAVVVAREDIPGQKRLVAYVVSSTGKKDTVALRQAIEQQLPDYMMPSAFVWLDELPKTSSGKIDKKSLPKPEIKRPDLAVLYKAPSTEIEKAIANTWISVLLMDVVGVNDNFFELGGNSLLALRTLSALKAQYGYSLPISKLYQFPTISGIAAFLGGTAKSNIRVTKKKTVENGNTDIAVIGMAGRFPGSNTVEELWKNLKEGKETIGFFSQEELDPFIPASLKNDPNYVKARGVISGTGNFDAAFFGITPKLAELMDPQQRIFLEVAWEALERSGHLPQKYKGTIGVFAGSGNNTYYINNVISNTALIEKAGSFQVVTVNDKDYVSTRTAYSLDLKGPAITVQSACSTSLLAVAQAAESIRKGQCDIAIAGGVAITSPVNSGHLYEEGAMHSRDGHTRTFDADATGTVFSDGAGAVILKSREQAEKDGDIIYAVIKGIGINNDGGGKGSFTAPSAEGQATAISMAINDAGIDPADISYIETHGTATPLGDPIEIEGLRLAFGAQDKKQYCSIGSIKSNMGHLTIAAGAAALIKTSLALYHKQIPPSINFKKANPNIEFENSPFIVNSSLKTWESDKKRIAGISSFGVGGTNVHIILEEFENPEIEISKEKPVQLINWSAKTESSLEDYGNKLLGFLGNEKTADLADIAYTLHTSRQDFNSRRFVVAASSGELIEKLSSPSALTPNTKKLKEGIQDIVFMFPGQGAQYVNMGRDLYNSEPVFKAAMDECAQILEQEMKENILDVIYPAKTGDEADEKLKDTRYSQPALFSIGYSLAKLWLSWGIYPSAFIGHSIGEFVAAHLSGILSLQDALKLIAIRGRMMSELPKGGMLSVRGGIEKIKPLLPGDISVAAINSPSLCVVSGKDDAISAFSDLLTEKGIANRLLHTSHAFHSHMMDEVVGPFKKIVESVKLNAPGIPIISTVTGQLLKDEEAIDPAYWSTHLRSTVLFADAAKKLLENQNQAFVEMGPGNVTATLVRQQAAGKPAVIVSSLESAGDKQSEYYSILKALGQLWLNGIEPDWQAFHKEEKRNKLHSLPTYAFNRKNYWVNPVVQMPVSIQQTPLLQDNIIIEPKTEPIVMRKKTLIDKVKEILENASGIEMHQVTPEMTFIEMGLDSLLLTQIALTLKKEFQVPVSFRQLNEDYNNLESLASYLDEKLPPDPVKAEAQPSTPVQHSSLDALTNSMASPGLNGSAMDLINQQLQILAKQVAMLQGNNTNNVPANTAPVKPVATVAPASSNGLAELSAEEVAEIKKPFGATARIEKQITALDDRQKNFILELTEKYNRKTKGSKDYTQKHRAYMADPRVVSGFRPLTKELVYSIVVNKSKGSRLWDIDGNEYIDALNGFGSNMIGYQPEVITKALIAQIEKGYEIGPQHELAGEVCKLICEFTNLDRAALCNTGSEAVLGAMRIARTVTGRSTIVAFSGSYHGIVDEVIVRGTKKLKSFPAAPGIMPEAVQNMLILDYGTEESLKIIKERAHDLAAVLVEPIQSRRPEFQPIEFLKKVREITEASGTALIFDEVISGFRFHPGGAQALFGIKADLGTYGKVVGAGISIGVIAGKKLFMDALDGGFWQYGDASTPEAGVTYFAGTFVRHPLALATSKASLTYMKEQGPQLQAGLTANTVYLANGLNEVCKEFSTPIYVAQYGSLWKIKYKEEYTYNELLFTLMRLKGIHILDGFPCFLTTAHTRADIDKIISSFRESVSELKGLNLIPDYQNHIAEVKIDNKANLYDSPPVPNARLGKDKDGNPAWFVQDEKNPGRYLKVNIQ
ncbi:MAG: amino acid adenylation domain-containing protein [Bacteroidota bacterium]